MFSFHTPLLIVHIASAAVLVGAGTGVTRNLKRTLPLGGEAFAIAAEDGVKRGRLMGMCSMLTLLTGLGLIFSAGGFAAVPINFHVGLALMLVAFGVSFTIMRPSGALVLDESKKPTPDRGRVEAAIKKLAMGQGILHLLWLSILTMMVVRIYR